MKKLQARILVSALLLPLMALAENWTKEQQEVLAFEEACIAAQNADDLNACFHEDYVGWGMGSPVPLSKADQIRLIEESFASFKTESLVFKPLSVVVKGNMAIVAYIDAGVSTNKRTDEVEYYTQRWTDVCLKEGGRWYWISDHGADITDNE
jgi:ketosteroid isomerase-like protein